MEKLSINLVNCYGIKKLEQVFEFTKLKPEFTHNANIIYAANGLMKSSLARVFEDIEKKREPADKVFKDRKPSWSISDENGNEIVAENIYVIPPLPNSYSFEETSLLLANDKLKKDYTLLTKNVIDKKDELFKKLRLHSGISKNTEAEFCNPHNTEKIETFTRLEQLAKAILDGANPNLSTIKYKQIFDTKIIEFLKNPNFNKQLEDYIEQYDNLVEKCSYFRKDVFNHTNASSVEKILGENKFFDAKHSINLKDKNNKLPPKEINSQTELNELFNKELTKVISDPSLKEKFDALDKSIAPKAELREFRDFIESNKVILPLMSNLQELDNALWISYLIVEKESLFSLLETYKDSKEKIAILTEEAKKETQTWHEVLDTFKERFSVPYILNIVNQDEVIFKSTKPVIQFTFVDEDTGQKQSLTEKELNDVISVGEKRALYILNILFDIKIKEKLGLETLLVIDDIADSFDYKNKYAIIEYIKDILKNSLFKAIILTHNFDFFQTVKSRLGLPDDHRCYLSMRTKNGIELTRPQFGHPFKNWKKNFYLEGKALIALIPFARNLIEYMHNYDHQVYKDLTAALHFKIDETEKITVKEIVDKLTVTVNLSKGNALSYDENKRLIDFIYECAEECAKKPDQGINLENKIVLSIAIRLKTEQFLIEKIGNDTWVKTISGNQTRKLILKYKTMQSDKKVNETLDSVNLMTPENIHINAFMYEPIMDVSDHHLIALYKKVKTLK